MYNLDQTWLPFSNLMRRHIYNVLLICSDYDRFMLEEDGRVEEELYKEYTALGLSNPPKITHTSNEEEALSLLDRLSFDLVITMLDFHTGRVEKLAEKIKRRKPTMPVIVLAPSPDHRRVKTLKDENKKNIDYLFYWQGNPSLFLAMVKLIEDSLNLEHDTNEADVQVIILIEDSVRFISSYLPKMYTCLIHQARNSILEALNEWGKTLRMRGRPKIVLARTGEEGLYYYNKYRKNILGIISDVNFPYKGNKTGSGLELAREIRSDNSEVPILIQSSDINQKEEALKVASEFLYKQSPTLLSELEEHFIKFYCFGPFNFIDPKTGKIIETVDTMKELQNAFMTVPAASLVYHGKRNDFSRWLRAKGLFTLATTIKNMTFKDEEHCEKIREEVFNTIRDYRMQRTRGVIAEFSPDTYDDTSFFSRIGNGSLGGKGRGLAFIAAEMKANNVQQQFPSIYLSIPKTVVISTSLYDSFINENELDVSVLVEKDDIEILKLFLSLNLPQELESALKEFLKFVKQPLSVRSSSLLEDSHSEPFAGVYQTCMLSNEGSDEKRFLELSQAVKTVYASVFFQRAREYMKITGHMVEEEKMAVILQQVTGSKHGKWWFPNVSGVARSLNYYPVDGQTSEDGVGMLSFGFGKSVVDDGSAFRFCPAKPKKPSQSLNGNAASQDTFYALDLTIPFDPLSNIDNLVLLDIKEASIWPKSLKYIASTLDLSTGAISESTFAEGVKMITFNGMLKYDMFPLAEVVDTILKLGARSMGAPVEIEIAVNTERSGEKKPDFSILQIRPIASTFDESDIEIDDYEKNDALIYAEKVMGNGYITELKDIITIKPNAFDKSKTVEMAEELSNFNSEIENDYILIAAGRLGSTDRWLGIPCAWSDISRARVIIETGLPDFQVEPSQGTHFFQNMTSLGCVYLTINPVYHEGLLDYDKLMKLEVIKESKYFIHLRANEGLIVKANGLEQKAVIKIHKEIQEWL